jgi:hypothetical protein
MILGLKCFFGAQTLLKLVSAIAEMIKSHYLVYDEHKNKKTSGGTTHASTIDLGSQGNSLFSEEDYQRDVLFKLSSLAKFLSLLEYIYGNIGEWMETSMATNSARPRDIKLYNKFRNSDILGANRYLEGFLPVGKFKGIDIRSSEITDLLNTWEGYDQDIYAESPQEFLDSKNNEFTYNINRLVGFIEKFEYRTLGEIIYGKECENLTKEKLDFNIGKVRIGTRAAKGQLNKVRMDKKVKRKRKEESDSDDSDDDDCRKYSPRKKVVRTNTYKTEVKPIRTGTDGVYSGRLRAR